MPECVLYDPIFVRNSSAFLTKFLFMPLLAGRIYVTNCCAHDSGFMSIQDISYIYILKNHTHILYDIYSFYRTVYSILNPIIYVQHDVMKLFDNRRNEKFSAEIFIRKGNQ